MRRHVVLVAAWVAAAIVLGSTLDQACGQVRYTVTDLGTFGGTNSDCNGINNQGQVVGLADNAAGWSRAFLYSGGTMADLGTFGGPVGVATGINDKGDVVGYAWYSDRKIRAFLYSGGIMRDLGTLGGPESQAYGINNNGQVIRAIAP
jgi:probable HAF family extracellular repeat protein